MYVQIIKVLKCKQLKRIYRNEGPCEFIPTDIHIRLYTKNSKNPVDDS